MDKEIIVVTGSCGRIGTQVVKRLGEKDTILGFELLKAIYASDQEELIPVDISSDESVHQAFVHIKHFYGNSANAVKTQIWIAISVYVLVAILRKQLGIQRSLTEILQILSVTLFEKTPVFEALTATQMTDFTDEERNQLILFDF